MIDRTILGYFEKLNQKWRPCVLCGQQLYPESKLIKKNGQYYCFEHYDFRFRRKELDKYVPDIKEKIYAINPVAKMPFELDTNENLMPRVVTFLLDWATFELDSGDNLMPSSTAYGDDFFKPDVNDNLMPRIG